MENFSSETPERDAVEEKLENEIGRENLINELRQPDFQGSYRRKFKRIIHNSVMGALFLTTGLGLEACLPGEKERNRQMHSYNYLPHSLEGKNIAQNFWNKNLSPKDARLMIAITKHESGYNQYEKDRKNPYRGRTNQHDVGIMQINEISWLKKAKELGFDIYTTEGNLEMALWIVENTKKGPKYWAAYDKALKEMG